MSVIFNILFPVISMVILGFFIGRTGEFSRDFFAGSNRLVYRYGLSPLMFIKTASMSVKLTEAVQYIKSIVILITCLIIIATIVSYILKMTSRMRGAFIHCSMRGNFAYVGLPVILYSFSGSGKENEALALAVIIMTPGIFYQIITSTVIMIANREGTGNGGLLKTGKSIISDPLIVGCAAGLMINLTGHEVPFAIVRTCESLGSMALPFALIGIGATIDLGLLRGAIIPPVIAAVIKTFISPLVMFFIISYFGIELTSMPGKILMLFSACSTAVSSYIITLQYEGDGNLAGSTIILSTFSSLVSLGTVILITS